MKLIFTFLFLSFYWMPADSFGQDIVFDFRSAHPAQSAAEDSGVGSGNAAKDRSDWSKEDDVVDGSISKSKLAKMKWVTGALVDFLEDSSMAGMYKSNWHGEYFSGKNSPGAQLKFGMTCHFADQRADLSIMANDLEPLMDQIVVNGQHFLTVRVPNGGGEGVLNYTDVATDGSGVQTKMWLITSKKGRLPFVPVSRKEYLIAAKAELMGMVNSIIAGWKMKAPVRAAEVQEAERKAVLDQLKTMYSGADLDIRSRVYLRCYKSDEQFQQENISRETSGFLATIRLMDSLLAHLGVAELGKPAVVSVGAADFSGFEDGRSNYMLIRMNARYFNNELSEEKAQVFLVTWKYDPSNASTLELDRRIAEGMDVEGLRSLLGK